ncbi:serine kinase [Bacillus cihuensis]|uniref:serine kinase n=1 Tax=Bacillus cihuensis TaxID=1208599 RepID=UPI0004034775|nr:serine kinase [Bacillus cihuensis]
MRFLFAMPLILIGAFLIGLTIYGIGDIGNVIMDIIGWGFMLVAILVGRRKRKGKNKQL